MSFIQNGTNGLTEVPRAIEAEGGQTLVDYLAKHAERDRTPAEIDHGALITAIHATLPPEMVGPNPEG